MNIPIHLKAPELEPEPIHVLSYEVGDAAVKMFKADDFRWVVIFHDNITRLSKALRCISYEHAKYVFDGCVDKIKQYEN